MIDGFHLICSSCILNVRFAPIVFVSCSDLAVVVFVFSRPLSAVAVVSVVYLLVVGRDVSVAKSLSRTIL